MRRFGYLDAEPADVGALYSESAVAEAIRSVQRFGDLPQTGVIDNATAAVGEKPNVDNVALNPFCICFAANDLPSLRSERYRKAIAEEDTLLSPGTTTASLCGRSSSVDETENHLLVSAIYFALHIHPHFNLASPPRHSE